jgi:hypothetical protein
LFFFLTATTQRCFGMTAGEIRQQAINLMLIGALLSIFPCSVIYCLMKKSNNNNNNGGGAQSNTYRANNNANSNFNQGPTIIGQQKQFQQQPMQQFGQQQQFAQQPVQAQFVQQPVQAQYAPQPVQAQYAPQPVYTPQPVQPVQQQYAPQPVGVAQATNVQFVSK